MSSPPRSAAFSPPRACRQPRRSRATGRPGHRPRAVSLKYTSDFPWDADFGDVRGYNTGVYEEPSRTLTNAQAKWTSPDAVASITVWGRNLTDEEYQVYGTQTAGSGETGMPGEPR